MKLIIYRIYLGFIILTCHHSYASEEYQILMTPKFSLQASEEGLYCKDFLKNGGVRGKHRFKAASATAGLWGVTIAGVVLTLPTIIGPILIGEIGGVTALGSTMGTAEIFHHSKLNQKLGNSIAEAYYHLRLLEPSKGKKQNTKKFNHIYDKFVNLYPTTEISKDEFAEGMVRANEAGWFCSLATFEKTKSQVELADLAKQYELHKVSLNTGKAKRKFNGQSKTLFEAVFPQGISAAPSNKEILDFQSRNKVINAKNIAAEKIRNDKNQSS